MSVCRLQPIYNYYNCIFICESYKEDHNKLICTFLLFILYLDSKKNIPRFWIRSNFKSRFTHKLGLQTPNLSEPLPFSSIKWDSPGRMKSEWCCMESPRTQPQSKHHHFPLPSLERTYTALTGRTWAQVKWQLHPSILHRSFNCKSNSKLTYCYLWIVTT